MSDFYLSRTLSFDLKDGDVFHLKGSSNTYKVFLITARYVHCIETTTEQTIRLNNDIKFAADSVYLIKIDINLKKFDGDGLEAGFLLK